MNKPTLKAIHICNSLKPTREPKLQKSMSLPSLSTERKKSPDR
jgi:hypothetical protein